MPGPTRHEFIEQHRLNVISPAQLTANTDNWNPTGISWSSVIRVSTDASRNLTGIIAPSIARLLILENIGAQDLVLVHDATSTAANRFYCPDNADVTLSQNTWTWLAYDLTSARWRVLGSGASSDLTIEDEGTPLATAATTLDFVGAGVTASGAGAEKTITISGAPTGAAGGDLSGTYPNPSVVDDSHSHTSATAPGGGGPILITDTPAGSPLVFADLLQTEEGDDLLYADSW